MLAVALSLAVLLGWQLFYAGPKVKEEQARQPAQQEQSQTAAPKSDGVPAAPVSTPEASAPGIAPPTATATRDSAIADSPRLQIKSPSLEGSIALKSGRIDDLKLIRYHETTDPKSPYVTLFSPANSPHPYFAEYGWVDQGKSGQKLPDRDTVWTAEGEDPLTPSTPVTLTWDNGQGLVFRRTISVDDDYMFGVVDEVENRSGTAVTLLPYARIHRYGTPKIQGYWILHEGLIGVMGEDGLIEIDYSDAIDEGGQKQVFKNITGGWLGITDKYWAATVIPSQTTPFRATFSGNEGTGTGDKASYQTDYLGAAVAIPPGDKKSVIGNLFAGAKQASILQRYQEDLGIKQFDLLIDWGWFFFITKPLFYLLEAINAVVHNFGVSILILTVLVRLAFFPLANKQFASMAKMKKLQPQMEQLRERYKDDKVRQQQALMELYKKEKVNPIAGCLPILLQLPVFFALYKVLFVTIDMRHAPFFGWIQDLSAPDPTSLFNLFGLLPYSVPEFLHIGVWPLLMGITMWLQMQLNPKQPDPVQQQIFNWMPLLFTFLLAKFPAGLVIYWAWSNTLSLTQQYYIMRKHGADIHLMANIKQTFRPVASLFNHVRGLIGGGTPDASPTETSEAGTAKNAEKTSEKAQPSNKGAGKKKPKPEADASPGS